MSARALTPSRWAAFLSVWVVALAGLCSDLANGQAISRPPSKKVSDRTPQARIAFANDGGIYNWQVQNDHTMFIQGQDRQWYKAVLVSSCYGLPLAERLGFESNLDGSFDRMSAVRVGEQSCPLASLTKTSAPKLARKAPKAAPAAARP